MQADLDLNGKRILNAGALEVTSVSLNGQQLTDVSSVPLWRSSWSTGREYVKNDIVKEAGSSYICLVGHTSGTFSTDLVALRWELFAEKGTAGTGTGDMLGANNLSDVADPATARANLGVGQLTSGSATAPAMYPTGDTNTGIFFPEANTIAFTEGGVEAMRINASGNVGIGTDNPQQLLHLSGGVPDIRYTDTTGAEWRAGNNNGVFRFVNQTTGLEHLRIAADGQIGFGGANYGTAGQVATSNGPGAAPSWQTGITAPGSAPTYACRAWVNFNGTGTVAIRASGNVSSITDNGTGDYTVNFATAMPDANYAVVTTGSNDLGDTTYRNTTNKGYGTASAGSCQIFSHAVNQAVSLKEDANNINVAVFR
jgi:hypothetical protein